MSKELEWALRWWLDQVANARHRRIPVGCQRRPVLLFTDGSCEEEGIGAICAGYGVVLFDPEDGLLQVFGGRIDELLLDILTDGGVKRQVVGQPELFPCVMARHVWSKRLRERLSSHYVDNEAARFGLIKGASPTRDSAWFINDFWNRETQLGSFTWVERASSACNCADKPSRGCWSVYVDGRRAQRVQVPHPVEQDMTERWLVFSCGL